MVEFRTIVSYFRPYAKGLAIGLVCTALANILQIAAPYLTKLVIDGLTDPDVTAGRIALLGSLIVLAAGIGGVFRYVMRERLNGISRRIETDLRNDFFRHLLRLDATFYGTMRTGDLMSRATNDTSAVRMAAGPAVMYLVNTAVTFVFALALMLWISPRLTLFGMIPMIGLPVIVLGFGGVIHRRYEEIQEQFSALSTFVQENLTGVRIVRAYTQEDEQARQFDGYNEDYRARNMRLVRTSGMFHPLLGLLSGVAMVLVLWLGGLEVMAQRITLGDFVAFSLYLGMLVWPMIALGWVVNLFQRGEASMGRLNRVLRAQPQVDAPAHPTPLGEVHGEVAFRDVSFTYPGTERAVLQHVSFVAKPGETVAIVGPTGSGKSTVVALLARLYDPTQGQITLDGVPITALDPAALRAHIGVVPQDPFLFSDSIERNIALGLAAAREGGDPEHSEVVRRAAGVAQLHEQILAFPHQYTTMLGERGINLSGGQKQRATLARALARDPVVLVLDDALSAVDTHTEAAILTDLRGAVRGTTAFIISHRVSAVMHADQILVIEDGHIVERGKHTDLIGADGTYARLLRRQLLEEGLEMVLS
ncbi:MAG: ABC transporter ATP-binding protein [Gemmatimonadetes bacterium]|nr:ABC transporter ATP-binding protein [Gemmatimonadota bacterium]